ncbi:MAG: hypothetical protein FD188_3379, partial [Ignavibacteria bacterium]
MFLCWPQGAHCACDNLGFELHWAETSMMGRSVT